MSKFYTEYNIEDLGPGINKYHSLDRIPDGMMSTLKNLDPLSNGQLVTRKGYEQYYGGLPLRATTLTKTGTTYRLEFDTPAILTLENAGEGSIVVAGDLPSTDAPIAGYAGDFSTAFQSHYYNSYTVSFKETFASGSPTTTTKTAAQTGISQPIIFVGWFNADSGSDTSNTLLTPQSLAINKTTYTITMTHTAASDISGYFTFLEVPASDSAVHVETVVATATNTITSATHGLTTTNFIIRCYEDSAGSYTEVLPQTITINAGGDVVVTFPAVFTGIIVLYAAPSTNVSVKSAVAGSQTFTVTGVTSPFNIVESWIVSGATRTNVTAGDISWDASTETLSIEYIGPSAETVEFYWVAADYIANSIEFTDTGSVSETISCSEPEITVWGISHSGIYTDAAPQGGHTHHIDNYKSESQQKLVSGINGNLLQATSYAAGGTTYEMTSLLLRGSNRVSGRQVLAPLFATSSITYTRTRGNITDASVNADGYATVTAVTYISSGVADYTFTFTNKTGTVAIGSTLSANDLLTIRNCANSRNNGAFEVLSVTSDSTTTTVIRVTNSSCIDATQDEVAISAEGNVFTDKILLTAVPMFIPGDIVSSGNTTDSHIVSDITTSPNEIYIKGVTAETVISDGINLFIKRTSSILPLARITTETIGDDGSGGFVRGDSLSITGVTNNPKIIGVCTFASTSLSVTVSSLVATVPLSGHHLNVGQKVIMYSSASDDLNGEFTVVSIVSSSSFTVATTASNGTYTTYILGKTIEIDESIQYTTGPTNVEVTNVGRWTVVENPKSTAARVLETKQQHWDESIPTAQPYIRSVVVNDSMFLVNDTDEVKKFDGSDLMNAGLPPWQGWFFMTAISAGSLPGGARIDYSAVSTTTKSFTVTDALLSIGERFKDADTGNIYTVSSVERNDVDNTVVYVTEDMSGEVVGGTDQLIKSSFYRYCVRINMVDANRNIISSAALGADDMYIELFASSNVELKIGGLPPFKELDHDRIEIEVYRTKRNTSGPFFRVHRQLVDYSDLGGYLTIIDSTVDDLLGDAQQYPSLSAAAELDNLLSNPPLASSVTTVDNRLLVANIKSPPTLDIAFRPTDVASTLAVADFSTSGQVILQKDGTTASSETFNDSIVFSFESSGSVSFTPETAMVIGANGGLSHTFVDADLTANEITEVAHGLKTGHRVRFTSSAADLPQLLSLNTSYYIIRTGADTYKVASSFANAVATTAIAITPSVAGTSTFTTTLYGNHFIITAAQTLAAGEWIYLFHAAKGIDNLLDFAGWYRTTFVTATAFLVDAYHVRTSGVASANDVTNFVKSASTTFDAQERVPVWIGTDGNFNQRYESSAAIETRVSTRLGLAINAVMSSDPQSNTYWTTTLDARPTPWLLAQSGQSFASGSLKIIMIDAPSDTLNFRWSGLSSNVKVFVNNTQLLTGVDADSEIRLFNSRLASSYPQFPEIFDDPYSISGGDGIIDVNPADGQEITAIIPFFGQSAFGSANLTQVVVVFKSSSIYLANIATGQIQKLQSQGQGCTAPRSVASTMDGIIFANESGIYKLGWDMKISWIGRMINDLWTDELSLPDISKFAGHNYRQKRQYKLSTVTVSSDYPDNVVVYDHTREADNQLGSWTEYTNHAATGWANQDTNAYYGSQSGTVFKIRNYGTMSDFRDDASAVAEQQLITGGIHYGLPANRKTTAGVSIQYQNPSTLTDVTVLTEQSLSGTFSSSSVVDITDDNSVLRYSLAERKGTFLRVKVIKSGTKDEQLKMSRMTFHVKDIGDGAVKQADET